MITCIAIDDDALYLRVLESYISQMEGVKLLATYENPVNGIMQVVKQKPDVLLIDREMPNLDGFEILETLDKKPKVIMISAHVNQPVKSQMLEIDRYLRKDIVNKEKLEEEIHKVLGN